MTTLTATKDVFIHPIDGKKIPYSVKEYAPEGFLICTERGDLGFKQATGKGRQYAIERHNFETWQQLVREGATTVPPYCPRWPGEWLPDSRKVKIPRIRENFMQAQFLEQDDDRQTPDVVDFWLNDPFFSQYGAAFIESSSSTPDKQKGHPFVIFDQPVTDRELYEEMLRAWVWKYNGIEPGCADKAITSSNELSYHKPGSVIHALGNVCPLDVYFETFVKPYRAHVAKVEEDREKKRKKELAKARKLIDANLTSTDATDVTRYTVAQWDGLVRWFAGLPNGRHGALLSLGVHWGSLQASPWAAAAIQTIGHPLTAVIAAARSNGYYDQYAHSDTEIERIFNDGINSQHAGPLPEPVLARRFYTDDWVSVINEDTGEIIASGQCYAFQSGEGWRYGIRGHNPDETWTESALRPFIPPSQNGKSTNGHEANHPENNENKAPTSGNHTPDITADDLLTAVQNINTAAKLARKCKPKPKKEAVKRARDTALRAVAKDAAGLNELDWQNVLAAILDVMPDTKKSLEKIRNEEIQKSKRAKRDTANEAAALARRNEYKETKAFIAGHNDIRMNVLNDAIYVNGELLTDITEAIIFDSIFSQGVNIPVTRLITIIRTLASQHSFNPVKQYFDRLPEWDNTDRMTPIIKAWRLRDDIQETFVRKWFYGVIARVYHGRQNFCLTWGGPQGIGKSTAAAGITPILPDYQLFTTAKLNPGSKDTAQIATTKLIWEIGELGSTTRLKDIDELKHHLMNPAFTYRPPYGRMDITKPHMASYIATYNDDGAGVLRDNTGNRRFAPIDSLIPEGERIDYDWDALDAEQLWAQVLHEFNTSEAARPEALTDKEAYYQAATNEEKTYTPALFEYLDTMFVYDPDLTEPPSGKWGIDTYGGVMRLMDIADLLKRAGYSTNNPDKINREVKQYLKKRYGIERTKSVRRVENGGYGGQIVPRKAAKPTKGYGGLWLTDEFVADLIARESRDDD